MSDTTTTTPWWQGTNFYIGAVMAFLGISYGVQEDEVRSLVTSVFGTIGAAGLIRERLKNTQASWGEWIRNRNTWNYAFAALAQVVTNLPAGFGDKVYEIVQATLGKNWTALTTGIISLATMVYFWLFAPKKPKTAPSTATNTITN